jgi:hypothetical protein
MKKKRKFTWDAWDYDCDGEAYIIAKDECPSREALPEWLVQADNLDTACASGIADDIREGWCAFRCRSDWENEEGPSGWYYVVNQKEKPKSRGWFPVWVVRKGEWY